MWEVGDSAHTGGLFVRGVRVPECEAQADHQGRQDAL